MVVNFSLNVLTYNFYYPFGMLVPNRHGSSDNYRYGFNGMEKDDELKGVSNSYDYEKRFYDPRVGRFLSLDPLSYDFPYESNYNFVSNNPIIYNDPTGEAKILKIIFTHRQTGKTETVFQVLDEWDIVKGNAIHSRMNEGGTFEGVLETTYEWHDINVTQNIIVEPDGSFTMVGKPTTSIGEDVLTESATWFRAQANIVAKRIDASLPGTDDGMFLMGDGEESEGGGVMFHSKKGRFGSGVRGKNKKIIDYINADPLIEFLQAGGGVAKGGSNKAPGDNNPSTTAPGKWEGEDEVSEQLNKAFDIMKTFYDNVKDGEKMVKLKDKGEKIIDKIKEKKYDSIIIKEYNNVRTLLRERNNGGKIDGGKGGNQGANGSNHASPRYN